MSGQMKQGETVRRDWGWSLVDGSALKQIVAFAVIFAGLTIGFELIRDRPLTWGTFAAIGLAVAAYAGIILALGKRNNRGG